MKPESFAHAADPDHLVRTGMPVAILRKYLHGPVDHPVLFFFFERQKFIIHIQIKPYIVEEDKEDDKLAEKEAQCAELEAKCAELEAKLSELEKFKADTESKETKTIIAQTLAQVKDKMDEKEYAKFEAKSNDCTLETVNAWRNEVLANVATVLMSKTEEKDESHLRMGVETPDNSPKGLWDRM